MAGKKVSKKMENPAVPEAMPSDEVISIEPPPMVKDEAPILEKSDYDKVRVQIPFQIKLKKRVFAPGTHIVERHMIPTILEIVDKKRRADLAIFTGKNFFVERLVDNTLKISEVENLDLKKMTK